MNKSIQKITNIPRRSPCCFRISLEQLGLCRHVQSFADTRPGEHVIDCVDFMYIYIYNNPEGKPGSRLISEIYVQVSV